MVWRIDLSEQLDAVRLFELIRKIEPHTTSFIRTIAPELSDDLLGEIAHSDWGNGVEENLALLIAIRESGRVSTIGYADPQEVLSLCHWTELAIESERRRHLI